MRKENKAWALSTSDKQVVLHVITGLGDGGAEAVLFHLCSETRWIRHIVVSLTDAGKYSSLLMGNGIEVVSLGMRRDRLNFAALWKLFKLIRIEQPTVVQTWMYHADLFGGLVARLAGHRNVVWGIHNSTLVTGQSASSTILVSKCCALLSRILPRQIVSCAKRAQEAHLALGYDAQRMCFIPNGYDLTVFRPNSASGCQLREELGLAPEDHVIGFVARFDPQKDHFTLLQALSLLQHRPYCLLIGTGLDSDNALVLSKIEELGLSDRMLLLGRRDDIPAVMNALDLHVMSSAFGEAFPNVLAEAMACGTPCVTTDVGDASEMVGETGIVVPPRDPAALASAIATLLSQRESPRWAARKNAARYRISQRYSLERMASRYVDVWFGPASENGMPNDKLAP